jgi:hypothetical protein
MKKSKVDAIIKRKEAEAEKRGETRCGHGFLRSQVPCSSCDLLDAATAKPGTASKHKGRARVWTDAELADALTRERSINAAARSLGMNRSGLVKRALQAPQLKALLDAKRAPTKWGKRFTHGAFKDLTGKPIAGVAVVERVENSPNGNATWRCKLACGHERIMQGIALRDAERAGRLVRCLECGTTSPGTWKGHV